MDNSCDCGLSPERCAAECMLFTSQQNCHKPTEPELIERVLLDSDTYLLRIDGGEYETLRYGEQLLDRIRSYLSEPGLEHGEPIDIQISRRADTYAYLDPKRVGQYGSRYLLLMPYTWYSPSAKLNAIKVVRDLTNRSLSACKELVERDQRLIFGPFSMAAAAALQQQLSIPSAQLYIFGMYVPLPVDGGIEVHYSVVYDES